ncbi:Holliday junction resolvase [Methanoculleus taiwanensis]|uniref:Holliday junction resolvase n=1 Tax=Methanoculleus taiwanensis TaxID=1550565 RepID=A0A498H6P0_9EURY|nr:Holliday junction resolvase-like protein [Methanoculleus taiwanensis]RXE57274.1 Holliday junction resolvase [Methanoculleus taiwanensis]
MIEWIFIAALLLLLIYIAWRYARVAGEVERRARSLFDEWRSTEMQRLVDEKAELLFREWKITEEKSIRRDAVTRSEAVIRGKVTEHLIPYFPDFTYNPKDARFLGTPVDFVIFNGLSDGEVTSVAFVEVKSGRSNLSERERAVRDCILQQRVTYEVIRQNGK